MKRHSEFFFAVLLLSLAACAPRPVALFDTETYTKPYETKFEDTLTIVLDEAIPDHFFVQDVGLRKMEVSDFRKSLRLSLFYTFENSFREVRFSETPAPNGLTLQLFRIRPFWKLENIDSDVYVVENVSVNTNTYYLSSLIRYDGALYRNGKKVSILDEEVVGEKIVNDKRQWNEAFKDGVKEMCEDLYKSLAEDQETFMTRK